MQIKDLFAYPITRDITQVIKLDDLRPDEIAQELNEYIVTAHIEQQILKFLEAFVASHKSQVDRIGVWLSGYFGSGKSHFAKILGYLLRNQTIEIGGVQREAIEIFLEHIDDASPRKQVIRELLTQIRDSFLNQTLMFQIKSQEDQLNKERESIAVIMYRQYLASQGLSSDPWIGRLELMLRKRGRFDEFRRFIESSEGEAWEELRKDFAVIRSVITEAMFAVMPETYKSKEEANRAFDDIRSGLRLTPDDLAQELSEFAAEQDNKAGNRSFKLAFIIDEIGQFIGDNGQRLLELQSIAENFEVHGFGRLWLIVTAQEALEDVIAGVKQVLGDYNRIIGRFDIQIRLTSEQIEQVLEERLLKKRPAAHSTLIDLFERQKGQITFLATPESNRLFDEPNAERFERTYPFLPYHFQLMQQAFATLRGRGGRSLQLSGAERSMLGVVLGILNAPLAESLFSDSTLGRLVTLDEIYDQVVHEINSLDRRTVSSVPEQIPDNTGLIQNVLKAVFMLAQVDWLPCTLDNISRLLMPSIDTDFNDHRKKVADALNEIKKARYVVEVEGVFRYLSVAERGIEDEIADAVIKHNDKRRAARDLLKTALSGIGRVNYQNGLTSFEVKIVADEEEVKSTGEIQIKVYSPLASAYNPDLNLSHIRDILSPGEERTVFWLPGNVTDPMADLERFLQLGIVINRRTNGDSGTEERAILREKKKEADSLNTRLGQIFNRALFTGTLIYDGDVTFLDGKTNNLNNIFNRELSRIIPKVYTRFSAAAVKVTEKTIGEILTAKVTNIPPIINALHLWDAQHHINTHAPIVQPVLEELSRRGMSVDGRTLSEHFERIPFGWNPVTLRVVLAALFRAGTISILIGQREYNDSGEAAAQEALTKSSIFNKAQFDYDPAAGLSLEQRREARRQIDLLFERQVDDTTNTLAQALREELNTIKQQNELLIVRVQSVTLPVPDSLLQGKRLIDDILNQRKPDNVVRAFLAQLNAVNTLKLLQSNLQRFISLGNDKAYHLFKLVSEAIERSMPEVSRINTETVHNALQDLKSLELSCLIIDRWNDAHLAGQTLLVAYRQVYQDLFAQRTKLYMRARDQLAPFGIVPIEITSRIVENPTSWDDDTLNYRSQQVTLRDLYNDIQLIEQRLTEALTAFQSRQEQDSVQSIDKSSDGPLKEMRPPILVRASDYLSGEISDETLLTEKLEALAARVRKELQSGRTVLIR